MSDGTTLARVMDLLRERQRELDAANGGKTDVVGPKVKTFSIIEKFDKENVVTPGVEGLTPFETIVAEDGQVIERIIHDTRQEDKPCP